MHKGQRVGYVRVSTLDQNTERQLDGIKLEKVFTDKASGRDTKRPQLAAALEYVCEDDTLIVHSLDRLARNVEDLRRIVRELNDRGVSVEFVKNHLAFSGGSDPTSRLMLTMLGAFADDAERGIMQSYTAEGRSRPQADVQGAAKQSLKSMEPAVQLAAAARLRLRRVPRREMRYCQCANVKLLVLCLLRLRKIISVPASVYISVKASHLRLPPVPIFHLRLLNGGVNIHVVGYV